VAYGGGVRRDVRGRAGSAGVGEWEERGECSERSVRSEELYIEDRRGCRDRVALRSGARAFQVSEENERVIRAASE
jgi:hypothetical protein